MKPELGTTKADKITRAAVAKVHGKLRATPFQANRMLAVVGSMYAFAARIGAVPEGTNPARKIDKFADVPPVRRAAVALRLRIWGSGVFRVGPCFP